MRLFFHFICLPGSAPGPGAKPTPKAAHLKLRKDPKFISKHFFWRLLRSEDSKYVLDIVSGITANISKLPYSRTFRTFRICLLVSFIEYNYL